MTHIAAFALVVPDYAAGLEFYVGTLGWELITDVDLGEDKRWILIAPPGGQCRILLARAVGPDQSAAIGAQTGGRVGFFLSSDNFERDYAAMQSAGVQFCEEPRHEIYGSVVVWMDPFGNKWDLIEPKAGNPL